MPVDGKANWPVRWPDGRYAGGPDPDRTKGSLRNRARELLASDTTLDDGSTVSRATKVVLAVLEKAEAGNLPAAQLLVDLTEEKRAAEQGDWHVTIAYTHQALTLNTTDPALSPPALEPTDTPS
jgi:hypothetical protein